MLSEPQPAVRVAAAARQAAISTRGAMGGADHTEQCLRRCRARSSWQPSLAASALALGGCGDDDVFRTDRPILRLTLDEYRVVPQNIVVKPGPSG